MVYPPIYHLPFTIYLHQPFTIYSLRSSIYSLQPS
ncbi:MAG: hypothetical protein QOJ65_1407 [Fimbriimonadaceae bacterium]|nr:hypothetical protein [Fimbriimonadaceae bacterium]